MNVPFGTAQRVSCIIPAYNEAPRIAAVLQTVVGHPLIDEVIVVDDGSSDGTAQTAWDVGGARVLVHGTNHGKSWAVATGLEAAQNGLVLLLDSDLLGLTQDDLTALIAPVRMGQADVSISLRAMHRACGKCWGWITFPVNGLSHVT